MGMLAACTVGPGTVVTCARAGAEYDLSLIWALVFASTLAYTLQEGTARLTIVSGKSLGQCLQERYKNGAKIYDTALLCWIIAILVFFGNTLYECNNWAGGIDAVLSLPGLENTDFIRIFSCVAYAVVTLALLYWDKVDMLGMFLGLVMMCMIVLFFVVVCVMGLDFKKLAQGLIPNIPDKKSESSAEPSDIILSLVGTTSLGFNLFLGGSMAKGKSLDSAQRGIAFSTISAMEVSVLILIVGAETFPETGEKSDEPFSIEILANLIRSLCGEIGVIVFAVGFISAALSSMLAVPLGAALTADSLFSEEVETRETEGRESTNAYKPVLETAEPLKLTNQQPDIEANLDNPEAEAETPEEREDEASTKLVVQDEESTIPTVNPPQTPEHKEKVAKQLPRPVYWSIISVMVAVASIVIGMNVPRVKIILIAQVFNGCLLPVFSICLLLCLNDPQFMSASPQKRWANIFLFLSVSITLFLSSNVFIQKMFGHLMSGVQTKLCIAGSVAVLTMISLCLVTSLGKDLLRSWGLRRQTDSA